MTVLLLAHLLFAVSLLGALTHQAVALLASRALPERLFVGRYTRVNDTRFTWAVVVLYIGVMLIGAVLYPVYRVDVRIPFEELGLGWAVGLFEIKEHAAGVGLGVLPLYVYVWRAQSMPSHGLDRKFTTAFLALIVWFDFIAGHVLNNIRGLA